MSYTRSLVQLLCDFQAVQFTQGWMKVQILERAYNRPGQHAFKKLRPWFAGRLPSRANAVPVQALFTDLPTFWGLRLRLLEFRDFVTVLKIHTEFRDGLRLR
jgi:hypothetical protein